MHSIIYDVAVSLDGFISGSSGDISNFAHDGPVVDDYNARMTNYAVAIMGRSTYEFGYRFGLQPGQNPYGHMKTIVFSSTLELPVDSHVRVNGPAAVDDLKQLKKTSNGPIYLCGGGEFSGWLLEHQLIDQLRLKRAPIILGEGVTLFGSSSNVAPLRRVATKTYDNGYVLEEFEM
jgi:dihydrofolate reductase